MESHRRKCDCRVLAPLLGPLRAGLICLLMIVAGGGLGQFLATAGVKILQTINGGETLQHLQETNTVCGPIASARYVDNSPTKPTYLNFDRPYPNQTFAAVVTASVRAMFKIPPEVAFKGKNICVTGLITTNSRGKPQMMIEDLSQIAVDDTATPVTNQMPVTSGP
jgi:hypothetical protein